ncbi:ABC transporter substrate-binding protein [Bifidobacterium simiarum]|uniref:ABC transporter substrate-binding protein n=1 Tax=Bifidobacterium simiarum TaxID=2045441 RepID=A0A2M9HFN7_9BIFI|nr:ABC transporter substrate-binding protein [Bifidobacterium simiarum]PJM75622.1 ABC transporter substrate-binding protein [Bifidobacterium simiarum]
MKKSLIVRVAAAASALAMAAGLAACGGSSTGSSSSSGSSLVVNTNFDAKSFDPARAYEFTSNMVSHQVYETPLAYGDNGNDFTKVEPGVAKYEISPDAKTVTLTVQDGHTFSDGAKVTADDLAFSLQRLQGMQSNPSFLLTDPAGKLVKVSKKDDKTVTLTSSVAYPALPYILAFPSTGVVEKKVVEEHGGTTDTNDKAETWLNSNSAGSGPYKIASADIKSEVKLAANDKYTSKDKPKYTNVVIQNTTAATQKVNVQAGTAQLAFDLGADDAKGLDTSKVKLASSPSMYTLYAYINASKEYGKAASDPNFINAFRHAINYDEILKFVGDGAVQPGGIIPAAINGALKSDEHNTYDLAKAKELLAKSSYKGEKIELVVPSDMAVGGVNLQNLAQKVQEQVKAAGINLELKPLSSTAWLDVYRNGTAQSSIAYWGADYPEAGDYASFAPDGPTGLHAGWKTGAGIATAEATKPLFEKAQTTVDKDARAKAFQAAQQKMNDGGPFVPIVVPAGRIAYASSLSGVNYNAIWYTDLASVK